MNESSYKEVIIPEQFILTALVCGNSKFVLKFAIFSFFSYTCEHFWLWCGAGE